MAEMNNKEYFDVIQNSLNDDIVRVIFSNSKSKITKVIIRPIIMDEDFMWHIESFVNDKVYHENLTGDELPGYIYTNVIDSFRQANVFYRENNIQIKTSKKGKVFVNESRNEKPLKPDYDHNRKKDYLLKEGEDIEPLRDLGLFTADNKIVRSKMAKFKQINKFIETIDAEFKGQDPDELTIVDFGCGKSYLTFIVYYYFKYIRNVGKLKVIGYDLKEDVVETCNEIADKYGYDNLQFIVGDIADINTDFAIDMLVTLHACDVATDYALDTAIKNDIKYIFSVPCCQHEVNFQIGSRDETSILLEHGLIKERFSALLTDSIRCEILKDKGYEVDVLEFVDLSHTPKNIMIRAKKAGKALDNKQNLEALLNKFGIRQTLFDLSY